jgi:hypothetical protein
MREEVRAEVEGHGRKREVASVDELPERRAHEHLLDGGLGELEPRFHQGDDPRRRLGVAHARTDEL